MNVDGAFILAETHRKTSVLLFVDSRFINDSDEFGKMFVARIALAHAFKKTNTNVTEQLTSKGAFTPDANEALHANDLHVKSMQRCDRQSCSAIRANEAAQIMFECLKFARVEKSELWRIFAPR